MAHPIVRERPLNCAVHECAHAVIAIRRGSHVLGLRVDGPGNNPGAIWKIDPDRFPPRDNIAIFVAGYVAEDYGHEIKALESGSISATKTSDVYTCRGYALNAVGTVDDVQVVNEAHAETDYEQWPELKWEWGKFQSLIDQAEGEVREQVQRDWQLIYALARILLKSDRGRMWEDEVYKFMGMPSPRQPL